MEEGVGKGVGKGGEEGVEEGVGKGGEERVVEGVGEGMGEGEGEGVGLKMMGSVTKHLPRSAQHLSDPGQSPSREHEEPQL